MKFTHHTCSSKMPTVCTLVQNFIELKLDSPDSGHLSFTALEAVGVSQTVQTIVTHPPGLNGNKSSSLASVTVWSWWAVPQ